MTSTSTSDISLTHPDFRTGVRDAVPLQVGLVPYGLIVGVTAVRVGLTGEQALAFSAAVFAGAAQLAAVELLGDGAPVFIAVLTATVVNLRILMYSASLAPYLRRYRLRERALLASVLVGMSYARSVSAFQQDGSLEPGPYYFGVSLSLYAVWIVTTLVGAVVGARVPDGLDLQFIVPLVFLAMAVSAMKDRPTVAAGVTGGAVATVAAGLPMRLNLVIAGLGGVAVGFVVGGRRAAGSAEP